MGWSHCDYIANLSPISTEAGLATGTELGNDCKSPGPIIGPLGYCEASAANAYNNETRTKSTNDCKSPGQEASQSEAGADPHLCRQKGQQTQLYIN